MTVVSRQGCAPAAPGGGPTLLSGRQPARKSRLVRVCVGPAQSVSGPKLRTCPPPTSTYASSFSTNSNESRAGSRRTTTQYLIIICTVMLINGSSHLVILPTLHTALCCTGFF